MYTYSNLFKHLYAKLHPQISLMKYKRCSVEAPWCWLRLLLVTIPPPSTSKNKIANAIVLGFDTAIAFTPDTEPIFLPSFKFDVQDLKNNLIEPAFKIYCRQLLDAIVKAKDNCLCNLVLVIAWGEGAAAKSNLSQQQGVLTLHLLYFTSGICGCNLVYKCLIQ